MTHGHTTPRPKVDDPKAARIALLSEEYLSADAARRGQIGEEIAGLIDGTVVPIGRTRND